MDVTGKGLATRSGIGTTACVVQQSELRFSRIVVDSPTLIVLRQGTKLLQSAEGQWTVRAGEAVAIAGGQTFDVTNRLSERGTYEARWLIWDPAIVERSQKSAGDGRGIAGAEMISKLDAPFSSAFDRALEAISDTQAIPDDVAEHRLAEVLVWLAHRGPRFPAAETLTLAMKLRRLLGGALAERWTAALAAKHLAMSEATLRRGLAAEGTSFGDILADVRMSSAMVLLQSTDQAVNRIALDVGYESASRFAIRFRERFGFPPTAIRGHARSVPPT